MRSTPPCRGIKRGRTGSTHARLLHPRTNTTGSQSAQRRAQKLMVLRFLCRALKPPLSCLAQLLLSCCSVAALAHPPSPPKRCFEPSPAQPNLKPTFPPPPLLLSSGPRLRPAHAWRIPGAYLSLFLGAHVLVGWSVPALFLPSRPLASHSSDCSWPFLSVPIDLCHLHVYPYLFLYHPSCELVLPPSFSLHSIYMHGLPCYSISVVCAASPSAFSCC